MKRIITEQNSKKDRLSRAFIALLVVVAVALSVGRVLIANRLVEASQTLRSLDAQIAQVQKENQALSEQLRAPGSIDSIEARAKEFGFVKTTAYVFLSKPPVTAMR